VTAWGVVAVCAAGGAAAGPFLDVVARRVRRKDPVEPVPLLASQPPGAAEPPSCEPPPGEPLTSPTPSAALVGPGSESPGQPAAPEHPLGWRFSVEAPIAAVVTAALFALAALRLGAVPQLAAYCVLFGALVTLSITDLRTGLVPRRLLYPALGTVSVALLAASAVEGDWRRMLHALIGGVAAFVFLGAVWWIYPKGMGFGDVRLAGLCGGALGWLGFAPVYLGFLAGFVIGALAGSVVLAASRRRRFPFAPALAAGTVFGILWGTWLGNLWLHPG